MNLNLWRRAKESKLHFPGGCRQAPQNLEQLGGWVKDITGNKADLCEDCAEEARALLGEIAETIHDLNPYLAGSGKLSAKDVTAIVANIAPELREITLITADRLDLDQYNSLTFDDDMYEKADFKKAEVTLYLTLTEDIPRKRLMDRIFRHLPSGVLLNKTRTTGF